MNIVDRFVFLYTLIVIIFTNCVGSIYYNKKSRVAATEPMVYLLPSSYVGRFYYFEEKKSDGEKSTVMSSVAFDEWETFNVSVHRVFRKVLGKRGIDVEVLPTVHPGWGALVSGDSAKEFASQYLTLKDVYKGDTDRELASMKQGVIVVFTKFYFIRVLQMMKAGAKYYVYALPSGDLVLVDEIDKAYTMKAVRNRILSRIGQQDRGSVIAERMCGLWYDEKNSYVEVCSLFADEIIGQIAKKCLSR